MLSREWRAESIHDVQAKDRLVNLHPFTCYDITNTRAMSPTTVWYHLDFAHDPLSKQVSIRVRHDLTYIGEVG